MSDEAYVARMNAHYVPLLDEHGDSFRALDWGSQSSQLKRFQVLTEIADLGSASVLDIGCGVGHLFDMLVLAGFAGSYTGVDAVPRMVEAARERHPDARFELGLLEADAPRWRADYVLSSGIFTFADKAGFETTVRAMFAACSRGVAFNALSLWGEEKDPAEFTPDPVETVSFCRSLTPWVVLRHDYMPHDFTVYLYREQRG